MDINLQKTEQQKEAFQSQVKQAEKSLDESFMSVNGIKEKLEESDESLLSESKNKEEQIASDFQLVKHDAVADLSGMIEEEPKPVVVEKKAKAVSASVDKDYEKIAREWQACKEGINLTAEEKRARLEALGHACDNYTRWKFRIFMKEGSPKYRRFMAVKNMRRTINEELAPKKTVGPELEYNRSQAYTVNIIKNPVKTLYAAFVGLFHYAAVSVSRLFTDKYVVRDKTTHKSKGYSFYFVHHYFNDFKFTTSQKKKDKSETLKRAQAEYYEDVRAQFGDIFGRKEDESGEPEDDDDFNNDDIDYKEEYQDAKNDLGDILFYQDRVIDILKNGTSKDIGKNSIYATDLAELQRYRRSLEGNAVYKEKKEEYALSESDLKKMRENDLEIEKQMKALKAREAKKAEEEKKAKEAQKAKEGKEVKKDQKSDVDPK